MRNGNVLYQAVIKDMGFKMIDNSVLWCLNSNPKNRSLKKDTWKDTILERMPVQEVIPEEKEKTLEEVIQKVENDLKKEEQKNEFRYDKSVTLPPERDPLNFDI